MAENLVRESKGLPKIGEGWISETELFYKIKKAFPKHKVIHHGRVEWLGMQHFDIYFPKINIAIEYQGKQHTEPIEFFGGETGLSQRIKNDMIKKKKCEENECTLIEVFPGYDFQAVKLEIENAILNRIDPR